VYPVEYHSNWIEFYPNAEKEIPKDLPPEKGPRIRMTVYVNADHARELVASGIATEQIFEIRCMLRSLRVAWMGQH
jgi:hypothetical protein